MTVLTTALQSAFNLLLPPLCPGCRKNDGPLLCRSCSKTLPKLIAPCPNCARPLKHEDCAHCHGRGYTGIHQIICSWRYSALCRDLILASKIREDLAAIKCLQHILPIDDLMNYDAVSFIPRSPGRRSGPHLAQSLARYVARQKKWPLKALLQQTRLPAAQHELPEHMRRRNTEDLFFMPSTNVLPQHILLVDDLITSGHTISSAAQCLRQGGIRRVDVLCLARTC